MSDGTVFSVLKFHLVELDSRPMIHRFVEVNDWFNIPICWSVFESTMARSPKHFVVIWSVSLISLRQEKYGTSSQTKSNLSWELILNVFELFLNVSSWFESSYWRSTSETSLTPSLKMLPWSVNLASSWQRHDHWLDWPRSRFDRLQHPIDYPLPPVSMIISLFKILSLARSLMTPIYILMVHKIPPD